MEKYTVCWIATNGELQLHITCDKDAAEEFRFNVEASGWHAWIVQGVIG